MPSTLFSFRADAVPIKQALALFARANNLNIVPDLDIEGDVTVEFRDLPLDLAMRALVASGKRKQVMFCFQLQFTLLHPIAIY